MADTKATSRQGHHTIIAAIQAYGKGLLGFIRKRVSSDADAEDVLQDVWYQLSTVINAHPVEQVGAWLYRVATNRIIDRQRKKTERLGLALGDDEEVAVNLLERLGAVTESPETMYRTRLFWQRLHLALDELPLEQREVFIWHELEGLSFAEIAARTDEAVGKLVSRKHYAVLHLRKRLRVFYEELID